MFKHRFVFAEDQTKFLEEIKNARKLEEEKQKNDAIKKLAELLNTADGRVKLGKPFYEGIRKHEGLRRSRLLPVQELPEGALPVYDRD
jgi:hypothetical protein